MILDEVVPNVPFPNDVCITSSDRLNLDNVVWPQLILAQLIGVAPCLNRFFLTLCLPCNHQEITVWQRLDIVMTST